MESEMKCILAWLGGFWLSCAWIRGEEEGGVCLDQGDCDTSDEGSFYSKRWQKQHFVPLIDEDSRWKHYLELINTSLRSHTPCAEVKDGCNCFMPTLMGDLEMWSRRGGIKREEFALARHKGQAVHYQVINHTLYRQEKCMFPSRCVGILQECMSIQRACFCHGNSGRLEGINVLW